MSHKHESSRFENFVFDILDKPAKSLLVILLILASLAGSVMMLPTKMVLAKMLPGKSTNTFTVYIDTPKGSSVHQTKNVTQCV
ncbi:MAG: AcrB/AcrD/AcrF family protein, partial [Campylobacterales bacterium]